MQLVGQTYLILKEQKQPHPSAFKYTKCRNTAKSKRNSGYNALVSASV
jgi:hypothetical protein